MTKDWVYLYDFSTDSLFRHGFPAQLKFFNWNNFNYPTKTFQQKIYVWAHASDEYLIQSRFFFYDLKKGEW